MCVPQEQYLAIVKSKDDALAMATAAKAQRLLYAAGGAAAGVLAGILIARLLR